ncbi:MULTISPECIES: DoxX family protein [unclassified Beijerinckia]|uniref:DoxX family protein n=1 Tax=unclassified Beijerinckia TaxID=2638183 RepID=UPI000898B5AB|nr:MULTISPECIES: DoxX family protein [unclassified Beijerinckia]MDH7796017.1 transmembrane protein [Beijerinckia sp. GAS462]SEC26528.1 transmembrane protein [Beijerinckia sp. 28-YEA-48]
MMSIEISKTATRDGSPASTSGVVSGAAAILYAAWFGFLARVVFTFMFWSSGLAKLIDFNTGLAEMSRFGLEPAWLFYFVTVVILLSGSLLIILDRWTWLGAGVLAVFTILTIPIAHHFWTMEEPLRTMEFHVAMEHITVVGALMTVTYASGRRN